MKVRSTWDLCAAGLSSLCLLHCLLLPSAVVLIPSVAHITEHHAIHVILVLLAAPVTIWVVWRAAVSGQGPQFFPVIAMLGVTLLIAAVAVPPIQKFEFEVTVAGSLIVASAHLWRWSRHTPNHLDEP